jgi:predicted PurR-regulated permease PerM
MQAPRLGNPENMLWIAVAAGMLVLLYFLSPILMPFLLAGILAYLGNPLVSWLERKGLNRSIGTVFALLLMIAVLVVLALVLVPMFYKEIEQLMQRLPGFLERLGASATPWLRSHFGVDFDFDAESIRRLFAEMIQGTEGLSMKVLQSLRIGGMTVIGFTINAVLVPVVLFYLLRDWNGLLARIDRMIPRRWHERVRSMAREVDAVLAEFLRGQLSVILVMSAYYSVALATVGLDFFLPIGIITGVLVFVPYVGAIIGLVFATLAGLLQFGTTLGLVWVLVAFGIGQAIEGMMITPMLVGNRIGLHPVAVIFALLAFGQMFGIFGILLALPASAILLVGLRHVRGNYLNSSIYND